MKKEILEAICQDFFIIIVFYSTPSAKKENFLALHPTVFYPAL